MIMLVNWIQALVYQCQIFLQKRLLLLAPYLMLKLLVQKMIQYLLYLVILNTFCHLWPIPVDAILMMECLLNVWLNSCSLLNCDQGFRNPQYLQRTYSFLLSLVPPHQPGLILTLTFFRVSCHCLKTCSFLCLQVVDCVFADILVDFRKNPWLFGKQTWVPLLFLDWSCSQNLIGWFLNISFRCHHLIHLHQLSQVLCQNSPKEPYEDNYQVEHVYFCLHMGYH